MGHSHIHRPWRQLAYAADTPVQQLHLVHGSDAATEMYLSWMTPGAVADPSVELAGAARVAAVSAQYAGYPGFFHHAPITGPSISSSVTSPMRPATSRCGTTGSP